MPQFIKYCIIGAANTALSYAVYFISLKLGFVYAAAAVISQIIGSINSYLCNKHFTFHSKSKSKMEMVRFAVVSGVQYLCNIGFITLFIRLFAMSEEMAGLFSIGFCTVVGFLGHKLFSFQK